VKFVGDWHPPALVECYAMTALKVETHFYHIGGGVILSAADLQAE
jgi:hypothetical protein